MGEYAWTHLANASMAIALSAHTARVQLSVYAVSWCSELVKDIAGRYLAIGSSAETPVNYNYFAQTHMQQAYTLQRRNSYLQTCSGRLLYIHTLGTRQHVCGLCQPFPLLFALLAPLGGLLGPRWGQVCMHTIKLCHRSGSCTSVCQDLTLCGVWLLLPKTAVKLKGVQSS